MRVMIVSSRTPEGQPAYCPLCGNSVCIEPSGETFDGPCPCCGHLLWLRAPGAIPSEAPRQTRVLRIVRDAFLRFGAPDRGTRIVLHSMHTDQWLETLELFVPTCTSWEQLFCRLWDAQRLD
jgi:hypothetical protein